MSLRSEVFAIIEAADRGILSIAPPVLAAAHKAAKRGDGPQMRSIVSMVYPPSENCQECEDGKVECQECEGAGWIDCLDCELEAVRVTRDGVG